MEIEIQPKLARPCAIGRAPVNDVAVTFVYQEQREDGGVWRSAETQKPLSEGVHYELDAATGRITLLEHGLWLKEGRWRAGDCIEPLLYRGQVKAPQRLVVTFEHEGVYPPE